MRKNVYLFLVFGALSLALGGCRRNETAVTDTIVSDTMSAPSDTSMTTDTTITEMMDTSMTATMDTSMTGTSGTNITTTETTMTTTTP